MPGQRKCPIFPVTLNEMTLSDHVIFKLFSVSSRKSVLVLKNLRKINFGLGRKMDPKMMRSSDGAWFNFRVLCFVT